MKNIKFSIKVILVSFLLLNQNAFAQKAKSDNGAEIITSWYGLQLKMIPETQGFVPPVVARAFGYTGIVLYQSILNNKKELMSLEGIVQELKDVPKTEENLNWALVANAALFTITQEFYGRENKINELDIKELFDKNRTKLQRFTDLNTLKDSEDFGKKVANHIYKFSKTDGGHLAEKNLFPKDFKAPPTACAWVGVEGQKALLPYWGNNRSFLAQTKDHNLPAPPSCEIGNTSILFSQALEVYAVGKNLSEEQKEIALFWADDAGKTFTPPGHGISIGLQLLQKENLDFSRAAELMMRLGLAANDAFISCWKCKYDFFLLRPISFIQTAIDPNWKSFLSNPPFPEYTSGHGTVSGAMAAVLSDMFGHNYAFTDFSHQSRGLKPRSFASFRDFAEEAALSRLYGGIHYRMSNDGGLKNGNRIGRIACEIKITN